MAVVAVLLAVTARPPAFAQTPPAPPAPKAAPKAVPKAQPQPAAPAPAQATAPQIPPMTFTPWTKVCVKGQQEGAPQQVCFTGKEGRVETGALVIAATVLEAEGQPQKVLRITLPLGMILPQGTRAVVDQGQPMNAPYMMCTMEGCVAQYEASEELIGKLKKGQNLMVQGLHGQLGAINLQVPLADFAKAYDGAPTPPQVFEERQKKLQEEYLKKQQALQQQQQQQQQGAAK